MYIITTNSEEQVLSTLIAFEPNKISAKRLAMITNNAEQSQNIDFDIAA